MCRGRLLCENKSVWHEMLDELFWNKLQRTRVYSIYLQVYSQTQECDICKCGSEGDINDERRLSACGRFEGMELKCPDDLCEHGTKETEIHVFQCTLYDQTIRLLLKVRDGFDEMEQTMYVIK